MGKLDLVDWPANRKLALSGSSSGLRIPLILRNDSAEVLQLTDPGVAEVQRAGAGPKFQLTAIPLQLSVAGNATARTQLRLRLDPAMPPGHYEGQVRIAGLTRPVAFDVLAEIKLAIRPSPLIVDAAAGRDQQLTVSVENRGNVPLTLDLTGEYPLGEEVAIASERLADPATASSGNPLADIFDRVIGRAPAPVLLQFGAVELAMVGASQTLQPGATQTIRVSLSLPEDLSPTARYHVFAPLYAADLHIVVVTAAKPAPFTQASAPKAAKPKAASRKKGAAA